MNSDMFQRGFAIEVEVPRAKTGSSKEQFVFDGVRIYPLRFGIFDADKEKELTIVTNSSKTIKGLAEIDGYPCLVSMPFSDAPKRSTFIKDESAVASTTSVAINKNILKPFDSNGVVSPQGKGVASPEAYNYKYYPSPLNEGYLYITSKIAKGVYEFEYVWNAGIVFLQFYTEAQDDETTAKSGWCFYANIMDEISLFFSPTALSKTTVLDELYKKNNPLQTVINCKDWMSDGKGKSDINKGILEDKDAWLVLTENNNCRYNQDSQKFIYEQLLSYTINNNDPSSADSSTRDVFVMVHDPFGVVAQVNEDLTNAHLAHESLIRSIRTGIDPKEIEKVFKNNTKGGYISDQELTDKIQLATEHRNNLDQIFYIHSLASGLYRAVYDENHSFPDAIKAEDNINEKRLLKVLAVSERQQFHRIIEGKRNALKVVLESDFFQVFMKFYNEIKEPSQQVQKVYFWDLLIEIKASIGAIYKNLAQRPFDKDNNLNLSTLYGDTSKYASNDPGLLAITALNNEENEAGKLISRKINLEEYLDKDFGKKKTNNKGSDTEVNINPSLVSKYIATTHEVLTAITKVGFTPLEITFCKTINTELGRSIIPLTQQEVADKLNKIAKQQGGMRYEPVPGSWQRKIEGNKGTLAIGIKRAKISKLEKIAHVVSTNPMFSLVVDLLAIKGASSIDKSSIVRNILDVATLVIVVQNTYKKYAELLLQTEPPMAQVGFKALRLTWSMAGAYVGVAIDVTDGFESWSKSDYDAMACNIVSVSAGIGSIGIAAFYAKAAWAGWGGLALATIAIGSKFLYAYYKDTAFEGFVKKTMFYDLFRYKIDNSPFFHMQELAQENWRKESLEAMTNKEKIYLDTKYLLEEFIYLHSFLFNFKPLFYVKKDNLPVYNGKNQMIGYREVISEVMLNISSDLSLLTADIKDVIVESFFVKDSLDLGFGNQAEPYPLFKNEGGSNLLFLSPSVINKVNNMHYLTDQEKQFLYEQLKYNGIAKSNLNSSKFQFHYHKKLGQLNYSDYGSTKFEGSEPIKAIHGDDNSYLVLMIQMKTSDNQTIPFIHSETKDERWLCYTYESKLDYRKTKAELKLKDSGIYTKNDFWKKTI